jgi:hypothetical protein
MGLPESYSNQNKFLSVLNGSKKKISGEIASGNFYGSEGTVTFDRVKGPSIKPSVICLKLINLDNMLRRPIKVAINPFFNH